MSDRLGCVSAYLRHAEFLEFPQDSRTLFLPIETVIAALE